MVTPDVAFKFVVRQPVDGGLIEHPILGQKLELGIIKAKVADAVQKSAGAGNNAVATTGRKRATEDLKHRWSVGFSGVSSRLEHGQLITVGEKGG